MLKLKVLFDAINRPEFKLNVPKVSLSFTNFLSMYNFLSASHNIVFESIRNGFKRRNTEGMHDFDVFWPA